MNKQIEALWQGNNVTYVLSDRGIDEIIDRSKVIMSKLDNPHDKMTFLCGMGSHMMLIGY